MKKFKNRETGVVAELVHDGLTKSLQFEDGKELTIPKKVLMDEWEELVEVTDTPTVTVDTPTEKVEETIPEEDEPEEKTEVVVEEKSTYRRRRSTNNAVYKRRASKYKKR